MRTQYKLVEVSSDIGALYVPDNGEVVAPNMGSFDDGIAGFKSINPPYARGGGTPATRHLENECLKYLARATVTEGAFAPSAAIVASGQAANHLVFKALYGGNLVASKHLFGTTKVDLQKTFIRAGGQVAYVDPCDTQAFIDATTDQTTAYFFEGISNPAGRVPDFATLSKAAKERGILVVVDMTLAAGMPKFDGLVYADVLTASLTKQASGGQNKFTGGSIIVSNDFPWSAQADRFPELREYFADASGNFALPTDPFRGLVTKIGLHEGSGVIAPDTALSIAASLPTMADRVATQCKNARLLAELLSDRHDVIDKVQLAGFNTDPENDRRTREYLGDTHFVMLVDLKGGFEAARQFIDSREFLHAVALGQQITAVSNPASSTHRQYSADDLAAMGIGKSTLRISVGCEDADDLRHRMLRALAP